MIDCPHPATFFWPLTVSAAGAYGCDACLVCGAGQPPFTKGARLPVPGRWRGIPAETFMATGTDALIAERKQTHGNWANQSATEQELKATLRSAPGWSQMSHSQKAAAEMICVKLSRIVNGNPNEPDHWRDLQGYARLAENGDHPAERRDV